MIAYLFLGLLVLVGVVSLLRLYVNANPTSLARVLKWVAVFFGTAIAMLLIVNGRFGLVLMVIAGLLPLFLRWRTMRDRFRAASGPAGGQSSRVDTAYLSMALDHDTGVLDGTVLAGRHKGRQLGEMPLGALLELLAECRADDPQSVAVLEAYLDRMHGPDWRSREEDAGRTAGGGGNRSGGGARAAKGGMTREEAYEILGVAPGAGPEEIKEAHRRLMLRNHPDQGGSTYLAAKINMAKDLLLGS